ncbi:MAG: HD domain-containing protein [Lachnospiraceae bacterium]|nr:HD domain-containing protein [Lachnospiraceae bacterium]
MNTGYHYEVYELLKTLYRKQNVLKMKEYIQHANVTTFEHCISVAILSYVWAEKLHLPVDKQLLVTGAFLHDFYLYDWHAKDHGRWHGFRHPAIAKKNAQEILHQPEEVTEIIRTHMWPLTFRNYPTSLEGWIVCFADKAVTVWEVFRNL